MISFTELLSESKAGKNLHLEHLEDEEETDYTVTIIGAAIVIALSILGAAVILRK